MKLDSDSLRAAKISSSFADQTSLNYAARTSGAAFQLYLSLYEARQTELVAWRDAEKVVDDSDFPARLNHYRRPPLAAQESHLQEYLHWQSALNETFKTSTMRLWQAMHPDPLSFTNNPKKIDTQVKQNCAYKTQLSWLEEKSANRAYLEAETDPTLLAETIPASQSIAF